MGASLQCVCSPPSADHLRKPLTSAARPLVLALVLVVIPLLVVVMPLSSSWYPSSSSSSSSSPPCTSSPPFLSRFRRRHLHCQVVDCRLGEGKAKQKKNSD